MKEIKLFDYQQEMLENIIEAFSTAAFDSVFYDEKGKKVNVGNSVMVQMPTGMGKTIILANVVFSFLEKDRRDVWVVAHRRELVSQIEETFKRNFSKTSSSSSKISSSLFSNHPVQEGIPTTPSLLHKEGSTSHPDPLALRGEGETAPTRRSEPLRSKVGGPSEVSPDCLTQQSCDCLCGVNRLACEGACNVACEDVCNAASGDASDVLSRVKGDVDTGIDEAHHAVAISSKTPLR